MSVRVIRLCAVSADGPRHVRRVRAGTTLDAIVDQVFPGATNDELDQLSVTVAKGPHVMPVHRRLWPLVRPKNGSTVLLRMVPGVVALANFITTSIGTAFLNYTGFSLGNFGLNAIFIGSSLGISALLSLGLNSLVPQPSAPDAIKREEGYQIDGFRNAVTPGEPVPLVFGRIRVAPVFITQPYSEIVGDEQYVRAAFLFGYGPLTLSDLRIGDTPLSELDDVEVELREGRADDPPLTIVPNQTLAQRKNVELLIPQAPKDSAGNTTDGPAEEQTHVVTTASDSTRASVIFQWPSGLFIVSDKGDINNTDVTIRIRQRLSGTASWQDVQTLYYSAGQTKPLFRQFSWALPSRGRWDIEITNIDTKPTTSQRSNRTYLFEVQSIRPEYPINLPTPVAVAALYMRASYQLSGPVDNFSAVAERHVPDWTGTAWEPGASRNPASIFAAALQGPHQPYPVPDAGIDWEVLADWHAFCVEKGLHYDRNYRRSAPLGDLLIEIAAAGRASPRFDGARWGVVIDRPQSVHVDVLSPRVAWEVSVEGQYVEPPDAVRVRFPDETNDYAEAERIVRWPGHTGAIDLPVVWEKSGKTNPDEIAREVYRDMLVVQHRRHRYSAMMDGAARVATRGDSVLLSHDVLLSGAQSARVLAVEAGDVVLDTALHTLPGQRYGLRFAVYADDDTVGDAALIEVTPVPGTTARLRTAAGATLPRVNDLVLFGPIERTAIPLRVLGVEPGAEMTSRLIMTDDAPEIDTATDAYVPEPWEGNLGAVVTPETLPQAPVFNGISTAGLEDVYGGTERAVTVSARKAAGDTALLSEIDVEHRLLGAPAWNGTAIAGGSGSVTLTYQSGDVVELRIAARSLAGTLGPYSTPITYLVEDADPVPATPDAASLSIEAGAGAVQLTIPVSDAATETLRLFRTAESDAFDAATDAIIDLPATAGQTVVHIDGDGTRQNLLDSAALLATDWTAAGGWALANGVATHTPGAASRLAQTVALTQGTVYRGRVQIAGRTAGTVTVTLTGPTPVSAAPVAADGQAVFALTAGAGATGLALDASADFDGTVTGLVLFEETPACLPQGAFDYRVAALNGDALASAISDAIRVTVF